MTQPEVLIQVLEIIKNSRKFGASYIFFWSCEAIYSQ